MNSFRRLLQYYSTFGLGNTKKLPQTAIEIYHPVGRCDKCVILCNRFHNQRVERLGALTGVRNLKGKGNLHHRTNN